jgi:hypothetical protein
MTFYPTKSAYPISEVMSSKILINGIMATRERCRKRLLGPVANLPTWLWP